MNQLSSSINNDQRSLERRLAAKLSSAKNALIIGVGGGNDSVTALLMKDQLSRDFSFRPERTAVAGMLPDILDYHDMQSTSHSLLWKILPGSTRSLQGTMIPAFSEPLFARYKDSFGISDIWGISMRHGSEGVAEALRAVIEAHDYDLILALDVGGDFIATPENLDVLSPMMDAYALHAFRGLITKFHSPAFVFGVFGLGTDGESTPEMLAKALENVGEYVIGDFDAAVLQNVEPFYRKIIETNRYSRTADFTIRQIRHNPPHDNPAKFRARFHTRPTAGRIKSHVAFFQQAFDPSYFAKYVLFDRLDGIHNPFSFSCRNGIEWFLKLQKFALRINHEIQGQAYMDVRAVLGLPANGSPQSLYFGTPSRKFSRDVTRQIVQEIIQSLENGVYDMALMYREDVTDQNIFHLKEVEVSETVAVLGRVVDKDVVVELRRLS